MSLVDAIQREQEADYLGAIRAYRKLLKRGSALDKVGLYQGMARCFEHMGQYREGIGWRGKAAEAYLEVAEEVMPKGEREYYALLELRSAIQDAHGKPAAMRKAALLYRRLFAGIWEESKEGYSHEAIFAGLLHAKFREYGSGGRLLFQAGQVLEQSGEVQLAKQCFERAAIFFQRSGQKEEAAGMARRARALLAAPRRA